MSKNRRCEILTYHSVNELDVTRALRVAVSSSVLGTSLVSWELGQATVGVHLGEVESTVQTARKVGNIDIEGELLVEDLEQLVFRVAGHEVDAGTDVLLGRRGNELESKRVPAGGDTVGALVVGAVESAVGRTGGTVGAESGVPGVSGVAVGGSGGGMEPAPVGVEDDLSGGLGNTATSGGARLPGESGVRLRSEGADLLTAHHGEERESDESGFVEHFRDASALSLFEPVQLSELMRLTVSIIFLL